MGEKIFENPSKIAELFWSLGVYIYERMKSLRMKTVQYESGKLKCSWLVELVRECRIRVRKFLVAESLGTVGEKAMCKLRKFVEMDFKGFD
jgi:hypothetical protein